MQNAAFLVPLLVLGGALSAQVQVGEKAPKCEPKEIIGNGILDKGAKDLGQLDGRLILYEFFAHW
ncbi:MAG: hypothetical protein R3F30_08240 [Planctomycetota bacterium]